MVRPGAVVLIVAAFQLPLIPLLDADGNAGGVLFWQSGPICVKEGVMELVITISIVTGTEQPPEGVKV